MREFNLLEEYPRPEKPRYVGSDLRTINHRIVATYRDKDFFDGNRNYGYGGFKYDGRWKSVAEKICNEYKLNNSLSFLQIGCEKGFLLKDLKDKYKKMRIDGIETSNYAITNSIPDAKENIKYCNNYTDLEYGDSEFDFIFALGVVYTHNLTNAIKCLREIQRVGKGKSFITLASYENRDDYWLFKQWSLLGTTILRKNEWRKVLSHVNYSGDYSFTNAELLGLRAKI